MASDINVRRVCLDALMQVMEDKRFLSEVLNATLRKYQYLEKNKRSYISRILRGSVERSIEIDVCISAYSSTRLDILNPYIRNILRMAVYEIRYMDAIPDSATCNEYVKLAKKKAGPRLGGFVNGILRNMLRSNFDKVSLKDNEIYSMPEWIYDKFESEYGDADRICKAFFDENIITIRCNTNKCTIDELREELKSEGVNATSFNELSLEDGIIGDDMRLDYAFAIESVNYIEKLSAFKEGMFYVQDISSMMVGAKAGVEAGDIIIDVCAAPGGKSLHIAGLLEESEARTSGSSKGHVYAYDISKAKVNLIQDNIVRSGLDNITALIGDARIHRNELVDKADIVIADLPCSGLGVIGKKHDIKLRVNKEDIESLAALQLEILNVCKDYVKKGGTLMYSSCTISRAENSDNVRRFLEANKDFRMVEEWQYMPSRIQDGFYLAKLHRHL